MRNERGMATIIFAVITALLCAFAAYGALFLALGAAKRATFTKERSSGRYLAEAGVVLALERLAANPNYPTSPPFTTCNPAPCCATPGTKVDVTEFIDANGDGVAAAPDPTVTITVTNCGAGNRHVISARRDF